MGGGPAGAAAALRARERGLSTLVLEAVAFPRERVGESLVYLWPLLEALGLAAECDALFQHKRGSGRVWGRSPELAWTSFGEAFGARSYSLQVDRARFDHLLLCRARDRGADVREGWRVRSTLRESGRVVGVTALDPWGDSHTFRARWTIDASGRHGLIAREEGLRVRDRAMPDLSVWGYVRDARRFEPPHRGDLLLEAVPDGWLWFIPLATGEVSVGLVCDRDSRPALRRRGLDGFLADAVASSVHARRLLAPGVMVRGPFATASHGYGSREYCGPGWLLAGDAGSFVDPMWATGVTHALTDGLTAAAAVEAVSRGEVEEDDALGYYRRELEGRTDRMSSLVRVVYGVNEVHGDRPFWRARRAFLPEREGVETVVRRMAFDPDVLYFRDALLGMRLEPDLVAPLEERLERGAVDGRAAAALAADLESWRPRWAPGARGYRSLVLTRDRRLAPGFVSEREGARYSTQDPPTIELLDALDGGLSAAELVERSVASAPPGEALRARLAAVATLLEAHRRGFVEPVGVA